MKRLSSFSAGILALGLALTALPTIAQASDSDSSSPATSVAEAPIYRGAESRSASETLSPAAIEEAGGDPAVLDYWTDERIANAIPVETPEVTESQIADIDESNLAMKESAEEVVAEPAEAPEAAAAKLASITNFSKTNGKVLYRNATDGKNYMCSGSAVNSGSKRLVVTAGHCVYGSPGSNWHQNWVFIPAYHNGSRPYGTFQAKMYRTFADWTTYGATSRGFNSDVAFVTTYSNASGQQVVNAVGGHGLVTGGSEYVFDASLFGYPGNLNGGEIMWACWGATGTRYSGTYKFSSISGCNFGGGASGGPWLKDYSNSSGLGYVKTISSWGLKNSTAHINGPFFTDAVKTLYNNANADW